MFEHKIRTWEDQAMKAIKERKEPPPFYKGPQSFFSYAIAILAFFIVSGSINWTFEHIEQISNRFSLLILNTWFKIILSLAFLTCGILLFIIRENYLLTYAMMELGVAFGTAFTNIPKLANAPITTLLTIMGAIYVTVRACDNLRKWHEKKIKTNNSAATVSL